MKVLNIVEAAYRGTLEEQDDTIVWFCHAMKGANADIDVLLRGNAVNYAVKAQDASGLAFGGAEQTQPPKLADDLAKLKGKSLTATVREAVENEHERERSKIPLLDRINVLIVPRANPDGGEAFVRDTAVRIDMNRDHLLLLLCQGSQLFLQRWEQKRLATLARIASVDPGE